MSKVPTSKRLDIVPDGITNGRAAHIRLIAAPVAVNSSVPLIAVQFKRRAHIDRVTAVLLAQIGKVSGPQLPMVLVVLIKLCV